MTKENILQFLNEQFALDPEDIEDDTGLFTEGLLDSFSIMALIQFLEDKGQITVEQSEVELDNLDTIENILAFIETKK